MAPANVKGVSFGEEQLVTKQANSKGTIDIERAWVGKDIAIIKLNDEERCNRDLQSISLSSFKFTTKLRFQNPTVFKTYGNGAFRNPLSSDSNLPDTYIAENQLHPHGYTKDILQPA